LAQGVSPWIFLKTTWWKFNAKTETKALSYKAEGTLQPLDGQREWFHEYCSLCYRDVDRNDICKPNTFFEYMVSIRWSPPFPPNGTWPDQPDLVLSIGQIVHQAAAAFGDSITSCVLSESQAAFAIFILG